MKIRTINERLCLLLAHAVYSRHLCKPKSGNTGLRLTRRMVGPVKWPIYMKETCERECEKKIKNKPKVVGISKIRLVPPIFHHERLPQWSRLSSTRKVSAEQVPGNKFRRLPVQRRRAPGHVKIANSLGLMNDTSRKYIGISCNKLYECSFTKLCFCVDDTRCRAVLVDGKRRKTRK